jgi:hypothetical protein
MLVLSLFLFFSLTIFRGASGWNGIGQFFTTFFGWAAYILAIGLIAFSVVRIIESIRQEPIMRTSLVVGLIFIWLLVLIESRLIMGTMTAGVLAEFLAMPLLGWPGPVQHVTVLGLLLVAIIVTFRIRFGHVLVVAHFIQRILLDDSRLVEGDEEDVDDELSPYLGQRPQFSRYSARSNAPVAPDDMMQDDVEEEYEDDPLLSSRPARASRVGGRPGGIAGRTFRRSIADDETEMMDEPIYFDEDIDFHEEETIEFDDHLDFGDEEEEDDPLNDINIHKGQIGAVPRGGHNPRPIDLTEHSNAIQGAEQHELFDDDDDENDAYVDPGLQFSSVSASSVDPLPMKLPNEDVPPRSLPKRVRQGRQGRAAIDQVIEMEPEPVPAPPPPPAKPIKSRASRAGQGQAAQNQNVKSKGQVRAASVPNVMSAWVAPGMDYLNSPDVAKMQMYGDDTSGLAKTIQDTLRSFRVEAEVREEDISIGPTIIRFGIRPTGKPQLMLDERSGKMVPVRDASGQIVYETRTRVSRIMALQNDLALVLEAKSIRMEAPVPGRPYVGVEIPNKNSRLVGLREVLESKEFQTAKNKSKLAIGLGKDVAGAVRVGDLAKMPHVLIAGATGAGKSVCINTIIASILTQATPDDVRLLMVDPKMVELTMYNGIPHLLSPVVTEVDNVVALLKNAISEMERRYRLFSQLGVRNLDGYRKLRMEKIGQGDTSLNNLPAIVIIIDELADLMMAAPDEVEGMICRLAQLARATGIHLVVATQRPSVDVITGLIKANIPTRISFMVSSAVDSRTIIDMGGAERLLGRGDMLYLPADAGRPERIQGAFLGDDEAQRIAEYWRQQISQRAQALGEEQSEPGWELNGEASEEPELEDDLLEKAEEVVREYGRASISLLQRRLRIGYSRAARLIDLLEAHGIIGQFEPGGRAREVYMNGDHQDHNSYQGDEDVSTMMDESDVIVEEEMARNEFVRNQAARFQMRSGRNGSSRVYSNEDEEFDD